MWDELQVTKRRKGNCISEKAKFEKVNKLAQQGKAGKALRAATANGVAEDTEEVQKMLETKFPVRTHENRSRPVPPFQHQTTRDAVALAGLRFLVLLMALFLGCPHAVPFRFGPWAS